MDGRGESGSGGVDVGARRAGEKLLGEVESEGLSSLLHSLRELTNNDASTEYFGIPELDALLPTHHAPVPLTHVPNQPQPQPTYPQHHSDDLWNPDSDHVTTTSNPVPPPPITNHQHQTATAGANATAKPGPTILELISPPTTHHLSSAGKTSLTYLITALAILPSSLCGAHLGGQNASVIIFDPLSHFSIPRLVSTMVSYVSRKLQAHTDLSTTSGFAEEMKSCVKRNLSHVHIFRPQSWSSLLSTLESLPSYLFNSNRHNSTDRRIHSLVLEDLDSFYYSIRSTEPSPSTTSTSALTKASQTLTTHVAHLSQLLSCATILTSRSSTPSSYRPSIPAFWPKEMLGKVTRLGVRRMEVIGFKPGISSEEAEAERGKRWDVVRRGRFECFKVGAGAAGEEGFVFSVREGCVDIEREEEEK